MSTVVSDLFSAMIRHQVKQDGSFSGVILSMLVIEGLGRCLDPDINIFTELLPYVVSSAIYKGILEDAAVRSVVRDHRSDAIRNPGAGYRLPTTLVVLDQELQRERQCRR